MPRAGAVVVGAGIGGLAAAIDLSAAGFEVTVVEAGAGPGGKVHQLEVDGARVDCGPTVLTMKPFFEELFAQAGRRLDDYLRTTAAEVLARYAWSETEQLELFADPERSAESIGAFAGANAARGFLQFRERAREVFSTLEHTFIRAQRPTPLSLTLAAGGPTRLLRIKPFQTLWRELGEHFEDRRLRQLFGRFATYCGSSPFEAPATLMLVAHVELLGVWLVEGGIHRLAKAMARLAAELGVELRYGAKAIDVRVERGRAAGVVLEGGEAIEAECVVLNADSAAVASGLLGRAASRTVVRVQGDARSLSAMTLCLHAKTSGFPLRRHNVFFCGDYEAEFADLFLRRALPSSPTVYLCAQDRGEGCAQVSGRERLLAIVNAPADGDRNPRSEEEIERCAQRSFELLQRCGLAIDRTESNCRITTPRDFERRFPGTGGALYGRATHGPLASFQRPGSRTKVPGLYLAGGSTHPGPGMPMAALSGRLAAASALADFPSTARSSRLATPGGTSTR